MALPQPFTPLQFPKERYFSLDVFRGATVALMILVNNPGSWSHIFAPLEHAEWHGCTPTDLVFPFFLFAVGNSLAFVIPRMQQNGAAQFWPKVLKRSLLIFLIGLFLNWSPFVVWQGNHLTFKGWTWTDAEGGLNGIRVMGVLQRIALCYLFGSVLLFYLGAKKALYAGGLILLVYWLLCYTQGSGDPYSLQGYFGRETDIKLFGELHVYHGEGVAFDPEGIVSTLPAIIQVILGYAVGDYIRRKPKAYDMLAHLFLAGTLLTFLGFAWDLIFPINKKIWSSSFVLYTTGIALYVLGTIVYILEFQNFHNRRWQDGVYDVVKWLLFITSGMLATLFIVIHFRNESLFTLQHLIQFLLISSIIFFVLSILSLNQWSHFFNAFGKNPLFIFVLSGFLPRALGLIRIPHGIGENGKPIYQSPFSWWNEFICKPLSANPKITSLIYAISMVLFFWLIAWVMNKKKIYVKV